MPHPAPRHRQIWVALVALVLMSACAPQRAGAQSDTLKTGQEVSEAAAKSTHDTDIDALVLSSSSMDEDADGDDSATAETPDLATPDAGLTADTAAEEMDAAEDVREDDVREDTDTAGAAE